MALRLSRAPLLSLILIACSSDPGKRSSDCYSDCDGGNADGTSTGGSGGSGASGGAGGSSLTGGNGGTATGGTAGTATGGTAGTATGGAAGTAGSATGGAAGTAGSATGGAAGTAGSAGAGGTAGSAGSAGSAGAGGGAGTSGGPTCALANGGCDPLTTCDDTSGTLVCGTCPPGTTGTGDTACSPLPVVVSLQGVSLHAAETGVSATLRVTRGSAVFGAVTVNLDFGSATVTRVAGLLPKDYAIAGTGVTDSGTAVSVVMPDGVADVDVTVQALDDLHAEAAESLELHVVPGPGYTVGATSAQTVVISANDGRVVNLNDDLADYALIEGSLRQAIDNANALADVSLVDFGGLAGTIALAGSLPLTNFPSGDGVTIDGPGIVIDGGNLFLLLETRGVTTLRNLTLTRGSSASFTGGILNRGALSVEGCTLIANSGVRGGAIASFVAGGGNSLSITGSVVSNNVSTSSGVIEVSSGTAQIGTTTFTNNTIANVSGAYTNLGGNSPAAP